MDHKLVGWARAVKARAGAARAGGGRAVPGLPPLWLFADAARIPDLLGAIRRLPPGLAGIVLRGSAGRPAWVRRVALACRHRGLALTVTEAGSAGPRAGLHMSRGRRGPGPRPGFVTSSAHDARELARARAAGSAVIFLSPMFATRSHPGAAPLGALRWSALARRERRVGALGGITGATVARLPGWCCHVGAIGAMIR